MHENQIIRYMMTKKYVENEYHCWEFVRDVYFDMFNKKLPEYPLGEVPAEFKNRLKTNIKYIEVKDIEILEGDIIIFSLFANQHAGVMIDDKHFIHLGFDGVQVTDKTNLGGNYAIYRIVE